MSTICIAGKNDLAVNILQYCLENRKEHEVVCVLNRNESGENSWQKSLKWYAEKNNIHIITLQEVYDISDLLFLSLEFDRIIVPEKFQSEKLFNMHFSLLPKYKGVYPSVLPILYGERETGVTLHRIRGGIDTGEIIDQKAIPIEPEDTGLDMYRKLTAAGTEVVIRNIDKLLQGDFIATPQEQWGSTYFSTDAIDYANLKLDVNKTAFQIQNQVRAFCFRPYQLVEWNGAKLVECEIQNEVSTKKPGTVLENNEVYMKVASIDYDVVLYKDVLDKILMAMKEGDGDRVKYLCKSPRIVRELKENWGGV
jgi:methionyl-tRNA formyltransferase